MRRELGITRYGLACCLCGNLDCKGCDSGKCVGINWCKNHGRSIDKGLKACHACGSPCWKGLLGKIRAYGFSLSVRRYGEGELPGCLERNRKNGVVYHREGITGDYDEFDDAEELVASIEDGTRE